ncbi:uncharacterized protein BJ171DRAFT_195769 [Polychytrium aggregatum]|uniref:uncharacterized protein n=1 Tax=Polychytrium aggregatum TaxID=110093 RepID=UPI0022FEA961|nr:uncharacterized protein BJ171DRAFT_195769 [Polychytrium aggregatum]KAI9201802.1 hypothetical protein BJ171DRAFT_195769 [Polychytrium aggregatum]
MSPLSPSFHHSLSVLAAQPSLYMLKLMCAFWLVPPTKVLLRIRSFSRGFFFCLCGGRPLDFLPSCNAGCGFLCFLLFFSLPRHRFSFGGLQYRGYFLAFNVLPCTPNPVLVPVLVPVLAPTLVPASMCGFLSILFSLASALYWCFLSLPICPSPPWSCFSGAASPLPKLVVCIHIPTFLPYLFLFNSAVFLFSTGTSRPPVPIICILELSCHHPQYSIFDFDRLLRT